MANLDSRKIAVELSQGPTRIGNWAEGKKARSDLVTGYLTCIGPHSAIWILGLGESTWSQARCGGRGHQEGGPKASPVNDIM